MQQMTQEPDRGGFSVGAGHAHHEQITRGPAVKGRRGHCSRTAAVAHEHMRHGRVEHRHARAIFRDAEHGTGVLRRGDPVMSVLRVAAHRHKASARRRPTTVIDQIGEMRREGITHSHQ